MAEAQKSYTGLFASISHEDDKTVSYLFYMDPQTYLKRYEEDWVPVDGLDDENTEEDIQIPVTQDFVALFDESMKSGKKLTVDDAMAQRRELEPLG